MLLPTVRFYVLSGECTFAFLENRTNPSYRKFTNFTKAQNGKVKLII